MDNTTLTERFEAALIYATRLHAQQCRKVTGVPYVAHLLGVTALVLEAGGSENEAIAALLHDAVEDQGGEPTRQAIREQFGETVAAIVDGCTEWRGPPKPSWLERKQRYLENLRSASQSVRRVSLADKLHNARSLLSDWQRLGDELWTRLGTGCERTLWFYDELLKVYQATGSDSLTEEFDRVVTELHQRLHL